MSAEDILLRRVYEWGERQGLDVHIDDQDHVLRNESVTALPSIILTDHQHRRIISVRIIRSFDTIRVHAVLEQSLVADVTSVRTKSLEIRLNSHGTTPCNSSCYDCFVLRIKNHLLSPLLSYRQMGRPSSQGQLLGLLGVPQDSLISVAAYLEVKYPM